MAQQLSVGKVSFANEARPLRTLRFVHLNTNSRLVKPHSGIIWLEDRTNCPNPALASLLATVPVRKRKPPVSTTRNGIRSWCAHVFQVAIVHDASRATLGAFQHRIEDEESHLCCTT